jgi:hypothetical protein
MPVLDVFEHFVVEVLSKFNRTFGTTRGAEAPGFATEGQNEAVPAGVTVHAGCAKFKDATVQVLVKGFKYHWPKRSILGLETLFPD